MKPIGEQLEYAANVLQHVSVTLGLSNQVYLSRECMSARLDLIEALGAVEALQRQNERLKALIAAHVEACCDCDMPLSTDTFVALTEEVEK